MSTKYLLSSKKILIPAFAVFLFAFIMLHGNVYAADNSTQNTTAATTSSQDATSQETVSTPAVSLDISLSAASGKNTSALRDSSYNTSVSFPSGDTITITSKQTMYGIYVIWGAPTDSWTLTYNGQTKSCGQYGYLHEYVEIPEGTTSCTITLSKGESICDISAYSAGTLPSDVQVWSPSCDNADVVVFSAHADDEILFMGGILATYAGQQNLKVQVVYMTNYWNGAKIREHEKLDGLWASGVKNYPLNGNFDDLYSTTLEGAMKTYDYPTVLSFVTEQVRRFKPLVCVTQDMNGEYGHGGHMILAKAVEDAANSSMNDTFCPESVSKYGTWDIPKTYLHLYADNKIHMNLRAPLSNMGGQTALDVASAAYKKHVSQQWCWFYVSDDYQFSCADFGLYRTTVGTDTQNDMLEHVTTYEEQARIAQEQALAESQAASEAESNSIAQEKESIAAAQKAEHLKSVGTSIGIVVLIIILIVAVVTLFFYIRNNQMNKHHKNKKR